MSPQWREQYARMLRWRVRLSETRNANESDADYELRFGDIVHAFFIDCYHLRDWLVMDSGLHSDKQMVVTIKKLAGDSVWLRRCRDICDGSKHLVVKKGRVTLVTRALGLEGGGSLVLEDGSGVLLLEGVFADVSTKEGIWDALEAADACLSEWARILQGIGLT